LAESAPAEELLNLHLLKSYQ